MEVVPWEESAGEVSPAPAAASRQSAHTTTATGRSGSAEKVTWAGGSLGCLPRGLPGCRIFLTRQVSCRSVVSMDGTPSDRSRERDCGKKKGRPPI